jgi:protein-tyrosine phosphatase
MVCLGNICRSPLAEGILKSKTKNLKVDSAGTAGYHIGKKPDIRSIDIAKKHDIDLTSQRARQFSTRDFDDFDKIYVMDNDNYSKIISLARNQEDMDKVDLILNEIYPKEYKSVPDPYYGDNEGFQNIYNLLETSCEVIAKKYETR